MANDMAVPEATSTVPPRVESRGSQRSMLGWVGMPLLLLTVVVITFLWINGQELDSIETRALDRPTLTKGMTTHLQLVAVSTLIVMAIAIPLGVILTRPFAKRAVPVALAVVNAGQSIPSLGLITLIVVAWKPGFWPVIIGLVAYSALPILRNTMVGLQQVDESLIKASRGMGLSNPMVLWQVELPLAVPVMIAGIRTALVLNVGTATLATFFAGDGLGSIIFTGIGLNRNTILVVGVVMASGLALLVDYLGGVAGHLLSPRGL